jgi:uncharacterized protein (DUF1501 family)
MSRTAERAGRRKARADYPPTELARHLALVAALIATDVGPAVYYVRYPGFDTHSSQAESHPVLLGFFARAMDAFLDDLAREGRLDSVLALTYSEFGRRVAENASRGTDHGAAAPILVFGGKVRGGVRNAHPSLEALDDGDLIATVDFRTIYREVAEDWLGIVDSTDVARGGGAPKIGFIA